RASITAVETATGLERKTSTNRSGAYLLPDLPAGEYQVRAQADGFRGMLREGLTVSVGQGVVSDFALIVGAPNETIIVSAEGTALEAQSVALSAIISNEFIAD